MKQKMSVWKRLKVCYIFFKTVDSSFLGEYCEYCKGHKIRAFHKKTVTDVQKGTVTYTAEYVCKGCGARAEVTEVWSK